MIMAAAFQTSISKFEAYPENLRDTGINTYRSTLAEYKKRLDDAEMRLCLVNDEEIENDFEVPIRDLSTTDGRILAKRNIHSSAGVTEWLGLTTTIDPSNPRKPNTTTMKKDPKSRFIYIFAEHSRDRLKITRRSLAQLLTYHQVMPVYLDFMFVFGAQSDAKDLRYSAFRKQTSFKTFISGSLALPDLGRSGLNFKLCYNLKSVTLKKEHGENSKLNEWSIRQAAFYHQFDVVSGNALWIVTKGRTDILDRYKELTGPAGDPEDRSFGTLDECFRSSLAPHLLYCHWSTEEWRWYIRWLEEIIDVDTVMAIYGPRGPGYAHKQYKPHHIQDLQYWSDKVKEAIMVLEGNVEVMGALRRFYMNLREQRDFPPALKDACSEEIQTFDAHLEELVAGINTQISRAQLLSSIIGDRKELIVQHLQGQATERTEQLNLNLEKEAILMRIITLVTLFYLPATFVSTFFSTDIIKYPNDDGEAPSKGHFSTVAMQRWLQVTIPLTMVTLLLAWSAWKYAETSREGRKQHWRSWSRLAGPEKSAASLKTPANHNLNFACPASPQRSWWRLKSPPRSGPSHFRRTGLERIPSMLPLHNLPKGTK